jgi:prephenate dehydrogenase
MKALIIGLGLIGGSLAKAFKKYEIASEIVVFDPNSASCKQAVAENVANEICYDLTKISQYQIIVIACPLGAFVNVAPLVFNNASKTALIFDVGSLKDFTNLDFKSINPNFNSSTFASLPQNFIPAHPIAGSHLTGYKNSDADLFIDKNFVVCLNENPTELQKKFAEQLKQIIIKIGSKPVEHKPLNHDYLYGVVSHLPQYLSFLSCRINNINFFQINQLSCPYLQKCFRLNASDKDLWKEIFTLNAEWLNSCLRLFWTESFKIILQKLLDLDNDNPYKTIIDSIENIAGYEVITPSPATFADIQKNSKEIILRLISVLAYLEMPLIKDYKKYAGKGFADFTSIINVISIIDEKTFNKLFNDNRSDLNLLIANWELPLF